MPIIFNGLFRAKNEKIVRYFNLIFETFFRLYHSEKMELRIIVIEFLRGIDSLNHV